jgi:hypothetical protein
MKTDNGYFTTIRRGIPAVVKNRTKPSTLYVKPYISVSLYRDVSIPSLPLIVTIYKYATATQYSL